MPKTGSRRKIREISFGLFERFLKERGYLFNRSSGSSHHIYKNSNNQKVSIVSKHKRTVHPKSIIIALHELKVTTMDFGDWMNENL